MCGIAGIVGRDGRANPAEAARAMAQAMAHRGPDDEGVAGFRAGQWAGALCARRLAIQDISPRGHQPMESPVTRATIAFNGELYNVGELRDELAADGREFRGHSDTEVVLAAYDRWGRSFLDRLHGMFGLAVWDPRDETLLIARDRLGIKPIHLHQAADGGLVFASELNALLASGSVERRLSAAGVESFLSLGAVEEPLTILEGVTTLPAGHVATWHDGRLETAEWWSLADAFDAPPAATERGEATARLRELLDDAVHSHLVSDVPLGVFLSGGIDSSALVGLVSETAGPPRTTSVVFPQQRWSEEPYIRQVAERFGTDHSQVELTDEAVLERVPRALAAMDQPSFDGVNTYIVSALAREAGLTVALSGVGSDELFGGYDTFQIARRLATLRERMPLGHSRAGGALVRRGMRDTDRARKLGAWIAGHGTSSPYRLRRELFSPDDRAALLSGLPAYDPGTDASGGGFDAVSRLELEVYMRNVLLRDTDVMSMAHSLEVRVPFLDHRVVEFVAALPAELKERRGETPKPLLLGALGDLLPREIVHRPKMGFTLPFAAWLRGALRDEVRDVLLDPAAGGQAGELLGPAAVSGVWSRFEAGKAEWVRPWSLYVLKKWAAQSGH